MMTAQSATRDNLTIQACLGQCTDPCPVQEQFQLFQTVFNQLKLPPIVDRREHPRSDAHRGITIVVLAELVEAVNVFLEGNRQCPGGVLLAMSAGWMSRRPSPDHPDLDTLYIHQAMTADRGGQTYLDVFSHPRRVSYLVNHLTGFTTEFRRTEGEELAAFGLDTPTSSSLLLNRRADDKLLTTSMCATVGVAHPITVGFWLPGDHNLHQHYSNNYPTVTAVKLTSRDLDIRHVEAKVREFLTSGMLADYEKVVVKPFGPAWNSCKGVSFHDTNDITGVLQSVLDLLTVINLGDGVLVQSYHATFKPVIKPGLGRHAISPDNVNLGFRVRAIVARTPQNTARMTQVVCAVNEDSKPIGRVNTAPASLELTLQQWGVTDVRQQRNIRRSLRHSSERLMTELMQQERGLTSQERGGHGSQTELVGIDLILTEMKGDIVPVVIEVNAHDCLYHATVFETMQPHRQGQATRTFLHTMIDRSQTFLMAGKTVVVIGAGGYSKRNIWKDADQYGVKVILVDSNPDHPARSEVHTFLYVNMVDHTQDKQHAKTILGLLAAQLPGVQPDGCLTFWEDCVSLAALVGEGLNLTHTPSFRAAMNAKSKVLTQSVLWAQTSKSPNDLPLAVYASPSVKVNDINDLEGAVKMIPLPAVLKLEFGSSAVGVKHVHSFQEAVEHVKHLQDTLRSEADRPGVGLGHGYSLLLMPCLLGTEHDVDVVLFEGQLVAAFLSDNGPTRLPLCAETAAVMPSVLRNEHQRQLVSAAASCCRGLGLSTGVFNVEMMLTARGPKLIEVNARMGGYYLRDWIRQLYNADLLLFALMCACGVRPVLTGYCSLDDENGFSSSSFDDVTEDDGTLEDAKGPISVNDDVSSSPVIMNGDVSKQGIYRGVGANGLHADDKDVSENSNDITSIKTFKNVIQKNCLRKNDINSENSIDNHVSFSNDRNVTSSDGDVTKVQLMGIMLYPSRHALTTTATPQCLKQLHETGQIIFTQFETEVVDSAENGSFEEPFGNLAVRATSLQKSRAKLVSVCTSLGLETKESLREILQDFVSLT
ncbi:carnosine synthase 1-like [Littorina saxatilis]|uniref:carnosine synthase 1-like n=1 Tax=Littorina saxatilis TaxID=31220 RepID=UPI0038B4D2DB